MVNTNPELEIVSTRKLNAPVEMVYEAFTNPNYLKMWWGPKGFTNTIHEFDLRLSGKWILTMHGPEAGNYENSSIFNTIEPLHKIAWSRVSQPLFDMEVTFEKLNESESVIGFKMIFASKKECDKIRKFAIPNNEENFDRLEEVLLNFKGK